MVNTVHRSNSHDRSSLPIKGIQNLRNFKPFEMMFHKFITKSLFDSVTLEKKYVNQCEQRDFLRFLNCFQVILRSKRSQLMGARWVEGFYVLGFEERMD